jgi:hypothetical protein
MPIMMMMMMMKESISLVRGFCHHTDSAHDRLLCTMHLDDDLCCVLHTTMDRWMDGTNLIVMIDDGAHVQFSVPGSGYDDQPFPPPRR